MSLYSEIKENTEITDIGQCKCNSRRENGADAIFEEIMADNFSKLLKNIQPILKKCYEFQVAKYEENYMNENHNKATESKEKEKNLKVS